MKKAILFLFAIVFSTFLIAQVSLYNENGEIIVDDTITFTHAVDTVNPFPFFEHKNFVNVVNETSGNITIRVRREEVSIIQGTEDYFCWNVCYNAVPAGSRPVWDSPDVVDFAPGDTATGDNDLSVYIVANNKRGEAVYKYTFIDTNDLLGVNNRSIFIKYNLTYTTSIDKKKAQQLSFNLYPNPTNNFVNVEFDKSLNQNLSIEIKDILGKHIETIAVPSSAQKMQLDLSSYSKGIYFLSVLDNQQILKTKKLIVK